MQKYHTFLDLFEISFFSAEAGMRKPEPEFFRLILDAMQVDPQKTLFVDDFPENIAGAQQLGMQTVWYTDREKCIPLLKDLLPVSVSRLSRNVLKRAK
jgi:putative hydrolase of the HAD superfamily